MEGLISLYSALQIIEQLYNNYYRRLYWPTLFQIGILIVCIPSAVCIGKWETIANDPRLPLMILSIVNGWIIVFLSTTCGSKVNKRSILFNEDALKHNGYFSASKYLRKRIRSKMTMAVRVADSFIDSEMPLNMSLFCVSNIISLVMVFQE